jgi:parvulin-like peptidyl-prolyl isomerase
VQTPPFSRPRFFWPIFCQGLAAFVLGNAPSQAAATDEPAAAAPAVFTPVIPTIPESVSRPKGWPTGIPASVSQHVLSSIRDNPGGPLEPVDPEGRPLATEQAKEAGGGAVATAAVDRGNSSGIIQADYEEATQATPSEAGSSDDIPGMQSVEMAMVVARVGPEVVLAGDLMTPAATEWLAKVSPNLKPEQIRQLKLQIYQQVLSPHIESLLVYVDACRTIPAERLPEIKAKVDEAFDQDQLPQLVKAAGAASLQEYEHQIRNQGQSLDRMRKMFFERALAQEWLQQNARSTGEIPHAEMIAWYQNHLSDYEFEARARFEQLTVKITPEQPRDIAWNRLAAMGNEVLQGQPLAEVAKAKSDGATARTGGQYDWTTRGSLVSKVIDEAIFSLPVGELSAILDDGDALHIIKVLERNEAGRTPFVEAQVAIREELQRQRRTKAQEEYLSRLRDRTPVWTMFDEHAGAAGIAGRSPTSRTR